MGSDTKACNGLLSRGNFIPAIFANTLECPAATIPIFEVFINPFVVSIPSTESPFLFIPLTSQFWIISTPIESAPLA